MTVLSPTNTYCLWKAQIAGRTSSKTQFSLLANWTDYVVEKKKLFAEQE